MGGVQHSHGLALYFGIAVAEPVMVNFRPAATRGKRVDCAKFGVKRLPSARGSRALVCGVLENYGKLVY